MTTGRQQPGANSPDLVAHQQSALSFYRVRLSVAPPLDPGGQGFELVPGAPVETFTAMQDRTVLAYPMKPMNDHMQRIFCE